MSFILGCSPDPKYMAIAKERIVFAVDSSLVMGYPQEEKYLDENPEYSSQTGNSPQNLAGKRNMNGL
jgi:hypothetical protein